MSARLHRHRFHHLRLLLTRGLVTAVSQTFGARGAVRKGEIPAVHAQILSASETFWLGGALCCQNLLTTRSVWSRAAKIGLFMMLVWWLPVVIVGGAYCGVSYSFDAVLNDRACTLTVPAYAVISTVYVAIILVHVTNINFLASLNHLDYVGGGKGSNATVRVVVRGSGSSGNSPSQSDH